MLITSNLVFSEWDRIFKNPMTTAAAIDRLVHHSDHPGVQRAELQDGQRQAGRARQDPGRESRSTDNTEVHP